MAEVDCRDPLAALHNPVIYSRLDKPVDLHEIGDVFETTLAQPFQYEMSLDALSRGGGHEDLAPRSLASHAGSYINDGPQGGKDPTRPGAGRQLAGPY